MHIFVSLLVRRLFLFSHKHKRSTKFLPCYCCGILLYINNHHVLWCKKVPKKDCSCGVESKSSYEVCPTLCAYTHATNEKAQHRGSSFLFLGVVPPCSPLFPMLFSSCSHGCSQKVPQVILSCCPPKAFIPNLCSPPIPKCQWKER